MLAAAQLGRDEFQKKTNKSQLMALTSVAVATVIAFALPVRQLAFVSVKQSEMRAYIDAVLEDSENWETVAPATSDFKNRNSAHFTHEALCLPPRVCKILKDYDDYIAPPPKDAHTPFFRNSKGNSVRFFARATACVMKLWGDVDTTSGQCRKICLRVVCLPTQKKSLLSNSSCLETD